LSYLHKKWSNPDATGENDSWKIFLYLFIKTLYKKTEDALECFERGYNNPQPGNITRFFAR